MKLLMALIAALVCSGAMAEPVYEIKSGFVTGQAYLRMAQAQRAGYAMGLVEGMFLSPFFGGSKPKLSWLESCATGMSDSQLVAVLDQFVRSNPVRWHESMHTLGFSALKQACERP